ncbi:hybrid sensor histidine kinase/response regulator transcription factor [Flavivirga spongiicola]|uniref:histidine kinase n=1 Tax=Flavivirga spongiicola TaxID=421621 RepID=A0ABU7XW70_9FLAO|nr:response regulator [Flavivirga sp. MEBiC05379]MDO5979098.1 response regulator [Flavivirga sp. MEBiC05379]
MILKIIFNYILKFSVLHIGIILIVFIGCNNKKHLLKEATLINGNDSNFHDTINQKQVREDSNIKYAVKQLDNTNGLSNSSVNSIFQDSENLLWIGTWDGLNRYDGSNFKIFRPELNAEKSLSNQVILKIDEDETGKIWVLTMNGINSYDKKNNIFKSYHFPNKSKFTFSETEYNIALDHSKKVFCAVKDWGIGFFNGSEFQKIEIKDLPINAVKKMEFAPSGELLVLLNNNDLFSLKFGMEVTGKKQLIKTEKISGNIRSFGILKGKKVALISLLGNMVLHSLEDQKKDVILNEKKAHKIIGYVPEGLVMSNNNESFIVNSSGKIMQPEWLTNLENQEIRTLIKGKEHIIWIGTDGDGLLKMHPLKKSFNTVSKTQVPKLDKSIVRAFLEVEENAFFIGTKGSGLFRFPSKFYENPNKPFEYENFYENNSSINNSVYALCKGQDDLVFIGTDGDGISVFDLKASKIISWSEILGHELCSAFQSTYTIYQDQDGFIWLGTNGYGMIRFKIERIKDKLKVSHFKMYLAGSEEEQALSSNIIFSIVPKNDHELWIGTRLGGLNLFNKETELFESFKNEKNNPLSLSNNDILCLHTDVNKRLWIGTSFGLNLLENIAYEETPEFKSFTVKDGLPNNTIHGIVSDKDSNLSISTNFGLSNFIINESKFINYTKNEGLQNNEFADGAFYQSINSDYIFMGGIKGFNYFLPSKIEESMLVPNILIDKISGQNEEVPYYQGLVVSPDSYTFPSIVLNHNQNFFDIELSALTYINTDKCQYAYKLDSFDKDWNMINNRRNISFTNVPKGTYSLWIKWSNSDGVWGKPVRAIDIKIKPVYWQSNIAFVIYLGLLSLFVLFIQSYYKKRQSLKQNIVFQKREKEIHQNRLNFFTNIAHEFQTPLTLILGPVQKLSESSNLVEKNQKFIKMIQRNSSRLLFLTQQLLEFRKAEYGHLDVTIKQFDIVSLIEQIAELFDEWALQKNIEYKLEIPSKLTGWFDKDKVEKIIFNLLSNAFKYTPKNGKINLKFFIQEENPKTLHIRVINTGEGIPKEKLNSIFDRFYLSDNWKEHGNNMFRTGIGLAYIKRLVTLLKGEILVSSEENKSTKFTVLLPCHKENFNDIKLDEEESQVLISDYLQNILEQTSTDSIEVPNKISSIESFLNKKKVVLIVEDEKEIHGFLNELLKEEYKILTAYNGLEALKILEKEDPDIIISDVMMPKMDGIELCSKIKNDIKTCHIPFIMLTAKNNVLHRIEGIESGANSYIPKPFHPGHLLIRIKKLIEAKEQILEHFSQDNFAENITDLPVNDNEKDFLLKVIGLIRNNIENENLQNSYIEEHLGMSSSQLYRKIKQTSGFSPGDLIRTIRLKHAAELLRKSTLTVSEVCYQSGFNNRSYFYREFKKMYNSTPKDYQLQNKPLNNL